MLAIENKKRFCRLKRFFIIFFGGHACSIELRGNETAVMCT